MGIKKSLLNKKRVLVVDDEPDLRAAIIFDLKRRDCEIFEASCGADAIEIVKNKDIQIVISDVRMPNGDGVDLLKAIRKINPDTPPVVLLATGFADLTELQASQLGAYGLIEKPINRSQMFILLEDSCSLL